jgi:hypothetical protein
MQCGASRTADACGGRLVLGGVGRRGLRPGGRSRTTATKGEDGMQITKSIERMIERILGQDLLDRLRGDRTPASPRVCEFGHPVFSGNSLCSYGHHAA